MRKILILFLLISCLIPQIGLAKKQKKSEQTLAPEPQLPPWVQDLTIPQEEPIYLVTKGIYPNQTKANEVQSFITQLMGTTPPDRVDLTDHYHGLPKGSYLVGMLFDSKERAQWWIDFSYRNRKIPKGRIRQVKLKGPSKLPYMPDPFLKEEKRLLTQEEALAKVKELPDVIKLAEEKTLMFKFTDYPRNGDLRYEIEILEDKGPTHRGVMVDFIMVSALDGQITERLSKALGMKSVYKDRSKLNPKTTTTETIRAE